MMIGGGTTAPLLELVPGIGGLGGIDGILMELPPPTLKDK
jgi:hypothetical protein